VDEPAGASFDGKHVVFGLKVAGIKAIVDELQSFVDAFRLPNILKNKNIYNRMRFASKILM